MVLGIGTKVSASDIKEDGLFYDTILFNQTVLRASVGFLQSEREL
jgi:hypothetical protein